MPQPLVKDLVEQLMFDVEVENPIDFADLPFDEKVLKDIALTGAMEILAGLEKESDSTCKAVLVGTVAHLVLENLTLHARLLWRGKETDGMSPDQLMNILKGSSA